MSNSKPSFFHTTATGVEIPVYIQDVTHRGAANIGFICFTGVTRRSEIGQKILRAFEIPEFEDTGICCSKLVWDKLSSEEQRAIILHEESHLVHNDLDAYLVDSSDEFLDTTEVIADQYAADRMGPEAMGYIKSGLLKILEGMCPVVDMSLNELIKLSYKSNPVRNAKLGL